MRRIITSVLSAIVLMSSLPVFAQSELEETLASLESVASVEKLETSNFAEKYLLRVTRPVNPEAAGEMSPKMQTYVKYADKKARKANAGTFEQRVIVCHAGYDRPTVLVTEGYWANYALNPRYTEELSRMFNCNLVVVEYRYFGESTPASKDWQYLTVANSLCDLHHVRTMLDGIYPGKWIATGISKGGQTTMFYRSYYPDDVDISVPYVAPLNKSVEDGRHEPFLAKTVGEPGERKIIEDFMYRLVKDRDVLYPMFKQHCDEKGYIFRVPAEEIYDLSVMEVRYAMWQYGTPIDSIPTEEASNEEVMRFFLGINEPDYFAVQSPYYSFDIMAAKELGYYGYDIRPFRKWMSIRSTKDYLRRVMLDAPDNTLKFDNTLYKHVVKFLKKNDPKMIYIYGETDPWGCSGVCTWLKTKKKKNLSIYVNPRGSHGTRINSFKEPTRTEIVSKIEGWLAE